MKWAAVSTVAGACVLLVFVLGRPGDRTPGESNGPVAAPEPAAAPSHPAFGRRVSPPESPSLPAPRPMASAGPVPAPAPTPLIKARFEVRFEPDFPAQVREALAEPRGQPLRFPLRRGLICELVQVRHEAGSEREGLVHAELAGHPGSQVTLAYAGEAVAGTVFSPAAGLFRVRYQGDGVHRVEEIDPEQIPNEQEPLLPPRHAGAEAPVAHLLDAHGDPLPTGGLPSAGGALTTTGAGIVPVPDAATVLDVMVLYTPECASKNGGAAGVTALINATLATANAAYSSSGAGITLRLAHSGQVAYTGSGNLSTDIDRLRGNADGFMDSIHALRNTYRADLVSLLVPSGQYAGIGYLWTPAGAAGFFGYGFTVVFDDYADANLTFAHEIGHNMGCGHAADDNAGGGAYSYSYGYHFNAGGTGYRTVMAYAPGIRIGRFSSPGVSYLGTTVGTADADNTQTILNSRDGIAGLYPAIVNGANWVTVASCDLDSSGKPDLVWRNTETGRVIVWLMDGVGLIRSEVLWPATNTGDSDWIPMAAGDLNRDGKPDLIWRHRTSGRVIVWFMNGTTRTGTSTLWAATNPGDSDWVPLLAGDFNADGRVDLIWRHAVSGRVIVWYMNGTTRTSVATLWPATNAGDAEWIPRAVGDFNRDGRPDVVWRHATSGRVIVWFLNGITRTSTTTLWTPASEADIQWVPMTAGDLSADSHVDLVWRNAASGRTIVWYMSASTRSGTTTIWNP